MYQRTTDREHPPRAAERRVGLFVDFEAIRRGLDDPAASFEASELAQRLRDVAQEQGRVIVASAYGDWTYARSQARDFRRCQIEPRMALSREPGDDRADLVLALDVQETLFLGPDLDTFVLATGESPCQELIQRLRRADRAVVLVAFETPAAAAIGRAGDRFVPLDELLALKRSRRPARKLDFSMFDWAPFIGLLDELEKNMPFVGFGWLLKKKLSAENCGCATMQEKQELMDRAAEEGILTLYKVDNIEEGGDPVTACKLNRENPRVLEFV